MIASCLRMARVVNSVMVGFAVLVGAVIASGGLPGIPESINAFLVGFLISASAMVVNDIFDVEIDRVNAPWRPLPSGRVSVGAAWACFAAFSAGGLALSALTGAATFAIALAGWLVGVAYSWRGKRLGFPGNVMVAFSVALPLLYGAALTGSWSWRVAVYWFMVFATVLGREVVKGIADVEGDRRAGVRTIAATLGERAAAAVAAALYLAAVAVSPAPVVLGLLRHPAAYAALVAVVDAGLVYEAFRILRRPCRGEALRHKARVLAYMLIGLVAFMAGGLEVA
ncbi:geranylgeranylglycerol-phosphate geranylgeranyltransferase [Stetteria hydrogenophila]